MNDCSHDPRLVEALADGELDALHAAEVEARIDVCASCRRTYEQILTVRTALRETGAQRRAPDRLRRRLSAMVEPAADTLSSASLPPARSAPAKRPWAWMAGGAGAALAACAVLAIGAGQFVERQALSDELVASHVRSLQAAHLTDVATSDQHVVKPWFDGKLDFSPQVIELKPQGFPLVGGRLDYVGGRAVAAIVYQRGRHTINLFVWPARGLGGDADDEQRRGYNLRHWRADGMAYWAVSDVNPIDLNLFEADLRARLAR
jgi:anti-sigma factor RsiW